MGERLLPAEVTRTVRKALGLVVNGGTAGRLQGALKDAAGKDVLIGGKTGTGDHRFERYGANGQLLESRVVNRTATFVFYLGDHYFGTLTALVPGPQAGQYEYTSSLVAQILKNLLPQLKTALFPVSKLAAQPVAPMAPELAAPQAPPVDTSEGITAPKGEKAEGSSSQADPVPVKPETNGNGGFPDSLDPNVVVPVPAQPGPETPRSAPGNPAAPAGQTAL